MGPSIMSHMLYKSPNPLSLSLSLYSCSLGAMSSTVPLLDDQHDHGRGGDDGEKKREERWYERLVDMEEAMSQLYFALPMVLTNVFYYFITVVSVMFAGHLGDLELAGSTLGNSWSIVSGLALLIGLSGGLETLCGQAYGGKLYKMLGIYLQASFIISVFFSTLVSFSWCYSESILIWLHQDPQISKMAGIYLKYLIPGLFAFGLLQCILRFLQTQSVLIPLVVCSILPLCFHVGIAYMLVHVLGLGVKGAAISASVSLWISFFMLALYVTYSKRFRHTWQGFTTESFEHVISNMKLSLPSAVMVCLEYSVFEILVLMAGLMPNSEIGTSLIAMCVNTESVAYMITYGLSAVASTRVSNEIGAGNLEKAKNAAFITLKLGLFLGLGTVLLLAIFHNIWASFFSSSAIIIREFSYMTPWLMISILFDTVQGVLSGVSRGCGWQHLAAWTNLIAFYGIGLPLALLFGFKLGLGYMGLWIGLICGLFFQASTLLIITLRSKWSKLELSLEEDETMPLYQKNQYKEEIVRNPLLH